MIENKNDVVGLRKWWFSNGVSRSLILVHTNILMDACTKMVAADERLP